MLIRHCNEGTHSHMIDAILELIVFFSVVAAIFGLVNWAKRAADGDKAANMGLYLLFGIPGGLLFIAGLALLVNGQSGGWLALGIGLGLGLPMIRQFRLALANVTPMDPASKIDFSGLAIVLAVIGYLVYAVLFLPTVEGETGESAISTGVSVSSLLVNFLAFVALAYVAVGYRNYRTGTEATRRLGLSKPSLEQIAVGLGAVVPAFILSFSGSFLTTWLQPDVVERLQETISDMTSGVQNPAGAVLLGLTTGIGEEVLFRGAIQPRFGIVIASVLWTLLHVQYELTWVIAGLFAMGIMLGLIRKHFGTVAAIITHAVYNALVVLIQISL